MSVVNEDTGCADLTTDGILTAISEFEMQVAIQGRGGVGYFFESWYG